jgi:hypothetical protein
VVIIGKWYVGSLIGTSAYNTEVSGCSADSVDLTVSDPSYGTFGGLVGMNRGTIYGLPRLRKNCRRDAGGRPGGSSNDGEISLSSADVEITGQGYLGGWSEATLTAHIDRCYANGNVSGWYAIGGLVGFHSTGTISDSYATGNATSTEERTRDCYVGGLIA